jgi:hypothetical protein
MRAVGHIRREAGNAPMYLGSASSGTEIGRLLKQLPTVLKVGGIPQTLAICGRSNVGKSSLFPNSRVELKRHKYFHLLEMAEDLHLLIFLGMDLQKFRNR